MSRIQPLDPRTATGEARQLLDAAQAQFGAVPNFLRVLAHSPKALGAFLGMHSSLGAAALDHATRERVALAVAEGNPRGNRLPQGRAPAGQPARRGLTPKKEVPTRITVSSPIVFAATRLPRT